MSEAIIMATFKLTFELLKVFLLQLFWKPEVHGLSFEIFHNQIHPLWHLKKIYILCIIIMQNFTLQIIQKMSFWSLWWQIAFIRHTILEFSMYQHIHTFQYNSIVSKLEVWHTELISSSTYNVDRNRISLLQVAIILTHHFLR